MFFTPYAMGTILGHSPRTNTWGDDEHRWWWVVTNDGRVFEEVERYMEVIDEGGGG